VTRTLEVRYESAAELRQDWQAQLQLGGFFAAVAGGESLEPFAPIELVILVGEERIVAAARLTVAAAESLCIEILPEARAPLGEAIERACAGVAAAAGGAAARPAIALVEHTEAAPAAPSVTDPQRLAALSVGEKVRLALNGTHGERLLLARERAGVVQASLIRNPRVTLDEVLALARAPHLAPEGAETLAAHRTFGASPQVALALVRNPRTPLPLAVELVGRLVIADVRVIAKGLGVRAQVAAAARKKLLTP
jgi:hypothetical protein